MRFRTPLVAGLITWLVVGLPLGVIPKWVPMPATTDSSFIPSWVKWNYTGYERKPAYPEYKAVVATMAKLPCGRAMWEYESKLDRYGTPMALMLLPYWTHGCIGSMEGLFFESSATTPYHFLNQSELSKSPSNPQRDLSYQPLNVASGVRHLQLLGVRYYMASSEEAKKQSREVSDLRLVATSGPWEVYEVADAPLVEPLTEKPAVMSGLPKGARPWLGSLLLAYYDPEGRLVYAGRAGVGINDAELGRLFAEARPRAGMEDRVIRRLRLAPGSRRMPRAPAFLVHPTWGKSGPWNASWTGAWPGRVLAALAAAQCPIVAPRLLVRKGVLWLAGDVVGRSQPP